MKVSFFFGDQRDYSLRWNFFFLQQHTKKTIDCQTTKSLCRYSTGYNKGFTRKKTWKGLLVFDLDLVKVWEGGGVWVIIKSNSCNSQWNSALAILIVRIDNDLNEREQIDLRLVCFFNEPLLLFCFLKLVLTFNNVRGSLECDCCKFS